MFSSPGSGKKPVQQEMVQVERSESASPFWRSRPSNNRRDSSPKKPVRESNLVVGASYSHADMLNLDSLSLSSSGNRPRTPPTSSSQKGRSGTNTPPPTKFPAGLASPPQRNYTDYLSYTNEDWDANDEDDEDDEDEYAYGNDDGDDFGLPSVSSMKRKSKRIDTKVDTDPGGGLSPWGYGMKSSGNFLGPRRLSNSADIAIERPPPSHPTAKKGEGKILRPQYKEILRDPANSLHLIHHPPVPDDASPKEVDVHSHRINRINKFKKILQATSIPLAELRSASWNGIPEEVRAMTWQLLLGYLPTSSERRVSTLERKRKEYLEGVRQAFERGGAANAAGKARGLDEAVWHQISIDVPRTNPHLELYGYEATQRSLERILYVWAVRHPASGYVQGINDLVTPFWQVFLGSYITDPNIESGMDPGQLPKPVLDAVEADSFWCLTKLLDGIQDNYIYAQPGIQRQVAALRDLTARIDANLAKHLEQEGVEFIQFSFRWMNCLLMREITVKNTIRMWDTYMAEEQGFSEFHLYVCAAFLVKWSDKLQNMDFQEVMMFLQALPTREWTEKDIELLLSEAFIWQSLFKGSSAHLRGGSSTTPSNTVIQ